MRHAFDSLTRRAARFALCSIAALVVGAPAAVTQAQEPLSEARLKAALLANLALFIDWAAAAGPLRMCVAGRGDTAEAARALDGKQLKNRAVEIVVVAAPAGVTGRGCHLLFITAATGARAVEYAQAAAGNPTLIVSEDDALSLERSHIVIALDEERRPVIEVNLTAARRLGLDISSRMLKLARKVL